MDGSDPNQNFEDPVRPDAESNLVEGSEPPEAWQDPSSEEKNFKKKKNPRKKKTRKDKKMRELIKEPDLDLEIPPNLAKVKISTNKNFHYLNNVKGGVYYGEVKCGLANGVGKWKGATGEVYTGEWRDGKADGEGNIHYPNGSVYTGQFQDDEQTGYGKGIMIFGPRDYYRGEFLNGAKHGIGEHHLPTGTTWKGHWKRNRMNGTGQVHWSNGASYIGDIIDDQFHGKGTLIKIDGVTYTGHWENHNKHGLGAEYSEKIGLKRNGIWNCGEFVVGEEMKNGILYKGEFKGGVYNGKGTLRDLNGSMWGGTWVNGL